MTVLLFAASAPDTTSGPLAVSTAIVAAAGGLIVANADGPADLLGTLTVTLQQPDGTIVVPAGQVTIAEDSDLGGDMWRYVARMVAPLTAGSYRVVWQDADQSVSEPVIVEVGMRPSIASVAALLRARTKTSGGREIGTFTADTRPTDSEAGEMIDNALDEVLGKVTPIDATLAAGQGYNAPGGDYERRIRRAVALYAAILIELSYWPEQAHNNQSPAASYQQLYDERIRALIAEGETGRPGGMGVGASGAGDAPADAAWAFPTDAGGLVGWNSRW